MSETSALDVEHSPVGTAAVDTHVSSMGALLQTVDLDLPAARGSLPIPLAIVYDGSRNIGAAGVGWEIPFSYVETTTNVSSRKPRWLPGPITGAALPARRVIVHLAGSEILMVPTDKPNVYRPFGADEYAELHRQDNGRWLYKQSNGLTYHFEPLASAQDSSRAYLTTIHDRTGHNKLTLTYAVLEVAVPSGLAHTPASLREILLTNVQYNFDNSLACARNQIRLGYFQKAVSPGGAPLAVYVDHGHIRARTRVLSSVEIWGCPTFYTRGGPVI
jgi:hypothetical protein